MFGGNKEPPATTTGVTPATTTATTSVTPVTITPPPQLPEVSKNEFQEEIFDHNDIEDFPQSVVGSIVKIASLKKEHKKLIAVHEKTDKMTRRQKKTIAQYEAEIDELDSMIEFFKEMYEEAERRVKELIGKREGKVSKEEEDDLKVLAKMFDEANKMCESFFVEAESSDEQILETSQVQSRKNNDPSTPKQEKEFKEKASVKSKG